MYFVVLVHLRVCCPELVVTVHVMLSLETGGSGRLVISNETLKLSILLTDRESMPCTGATCGGTAQNGATKSYIADVHTLQTSCLNSEIEVQQTVHAHNIIQYLVLKVLDRMHLLFRVR